MTGIVSYGAYIPIYRLGHEEIARVWGSSSRKGERAVANCDEDSITMAVEAVTDCLSGQDRNLIDGLYFASTTPPYRVKRSSTIIAAAVDLRQDIFTADFTDSTGAGASALRAAFHAVRSGAAKQVMVVAADCQLAPPNSASELVFGDGAAALLIGDANAIATFEQQNVCSSNLIDVWRREKGDTYLRTWEDRFVIEHGYTAYTKEAISSLLKSSKLSSKEISKFAYYGPDARSHAGLAKTLGLDRNQVQDPMFDSVGCTGAAFFVMILIAALEQAKGGDNIVATSYGDGADAFLIEVSKDFAPIHRRGIAGHLASKMSLLNYGTYLKFRNLMEWEKTPMPEADSSVTVMWRDNKALVRGYGQRCKACGHIQFPPQIVCMWCQQKGQFEDIRLVDRKGKIFTFSLDERAVFALDLPNVIAIVDIDGGGRMYSQMTDREPKKIHVGMPVELTFRKFHEGGGFHNYSWKCRPLRIQEV